MKPAVDQARALIAMLSDAAERPADVLGPSRAIGLISELFRRQLQTGKWRCRRSAAAKQVVQSIQPEGRVEALPACQPIREEGS